MVVFKDICAVLAGHVAKDKITSGVFVEKVRYIVHLAIDNYQNSTIFVFLRVYLLHRKLAKRRLSASFFSLEHHSRVSTHCALDILSLSERSQVQVRKVSFCFSYSSVSWMLLVAPAVNSAVLTRVVSNASLARKLKVSQLSTKT
jgi:hypothetical protein